MKLESLISTLGDHMRDAAVIAKAQPVVQPGPVIVWCNKAFSTMTGYEFSEVVGNTPRMMHGPETCKETGKRIGQRLRAWQPVRERVLNYKKDGTKFWVELDIRPIADENGEYHYWVAIQRDVTEQVHITRQMEIMNKKLSLCLEGGNIGAWEWDIPTNQVDYSDKNFELLGLQANKEKDKSILEWWDEHVHPEDKKYLLNALDRHIKHNAPYNVTYRIRHASGDWRWWRSIGQACRDANGIAITMSGINTDVTDLLEAQLKAQQANRLKSEFLANMSHEIRTPLNGILGMTQLLAKSDVNEKQQKFVQRINASGASLLGIINDVLDISKIETGVLELEQEAFDIRQVLQQAAETVASNADQKGLTVSIESNIPEGFEMQGDANRLRQVLVNLAGNAVKFTDEGGVTLSAIKEGETIEFAVADTGPGIPKSEHKAIFGRFVQVDGSSTRKHGGTGLGLAIAKDLVGLMGGELNIESDVGAGAKFFFQMPFIEPVAHVLEAHTEELEDPSSVSAPSNKSVRVLVAEDNIVNQEIIKEIFSGFDHVALTFAENGQVALDHLNEDVFDLVLMDISMPVLSGDEAIKIIRTHDSPYRNIPIFVLTADANPESREKYISIGADDCLIKPINLQDVTRTVNLMLKTPDRESRLDAALSKLKRRLISEEKQEREDRKPCNIAAEVRSDDADPVACSIIDLSPSGAGILIESEQRLPAYFRLFLNDSDQSFMGRLAWQSKNHAGVEFLMFNDGFQKKRIRQMLEMLYEEESQRRLQA